MLQEQWRTLSLCEQLGNIGSEVGRALAWQKRGDDVHKEQALARALELFDLTLAGRHTLSRLKELTRAREVLADFFYNNNTYHSSPETLERYFYYFAYAARKDR